MCYTIPDFEVEVIGIENSKSEEDKIMLIHINPSTNRVLRSTADKVFLRVDDESKTLTHDQVTKLEYDKGERLFEEELLDRSSIKDLDIELMQRYRSIMDTTNTDEEILEARGLMYEGKFTVAGALLFAKSPTKFLPNARLKFLRYEGIKAETGTRINLIKDITIEGSIPKAIEDAKVLISSKLRDFQSLDASGKFNALPEYPEFAWFEGIVNALTHRDYSFKGDYIRITMYDDRLEILSPGHLPNIVNVENMKETRYSRNPKIARVLSEFGWVKEINEGVKRIYEEMKKFFLKNPTYSEPNDNSVLLVLENNIIARHFRRNEYLAEKIEGEIFDSLSEEECTILQTTYSLGSITSKQAGKLINRSTDYSRNILKKLVDLDIFEWHGSSTRDPKQYYSVKDK